MNITELTNERKNEILSKMVGWFDDHYSDNELLFVLKEQLELSDNEINALGWDIGELHSKVDAFRNEYLEYLKKSVKEYCNENGYIEVYWDYRDCASKDTIQNHINNIVSGMTDITSLEGAIFEELDIYYEVIDEYETDLRNHIIDNVPNNEIKNYIEEMEFSSLIDDLYDCGYNGVDYNIDQLLSNTTIKVNILFGTEKEKDYDMGSIVTAFGNDYQTPFKDWNLDNNDVDRLDNALTYLIHQQGHTVKEVYDALINPDASIRTNSTFINGICTDIQNNSSEAMSELGVYISLSGSEITEFCDNLQNGNGYIVVDKDTNIGIFNEWSGTCGYPDRYLEKDFVVPVEMIRNVQIEGASKSNYEYTINEVCGMVGEFWKDNALSYTEIAPELVQENLNTVLEEINAEVEKLSELEEIER